MQWGKNNPVQNQLIKGVVVKKADGQKCVKTDKKSCAKKCGKNENTSYSKNAKSENKKCSKGDACCQKTREKRADCDKKNKGCCASAK